MSTDSFDRDKKKLDEAFERAKAAVAAGEEPSPSDMLATVQRVQLSRAERAKLENKGPTAVEMARQISEGIKKILGNDILCHAKQGMRLTSSHDTVMVTCASVPKGSAEIDALNAKTNPMWHITEAKGEQWLLDGPSPAKVTIEMFRGDIRKEKKQFDVWTAAGKAASKANSIPFRKKTDSPEKVVKYLLDFIKKNREHFLP